MDRDDKGRARLGGWDLEQVLAETGITTPAYVYDVGAMAAEARDLAAGFGDTRHLIAYAIKANSAAGVVSALAEAGCGAEVGSLAELRVARACGIEPQDILQSGVAKTDAELDAAIAQGIGAIQIDCVEEIARVEARAASLNRDVPVSLRLNPSIEADTHAAIATGHDDAKFGIALSNLGSAFEAVATAPHVKLVGLASHIGSQLTSTGAYFEAVDLVLSIAKEREARGEHFTMLDFGGGFGIDYGKGCAVRPRDFAEGACERARRAGFGDRRLVVEPGRALVGPHGVVVSTVVASKRSGGHHWLIIDAGMNDLLRPALYQARHRIEPLHRAPDAAAPPHRVVGPVCESSDDFGSYNLCGELPRRVVIRDTGAYGFTMASNYNGRGLPSEVFIHADGSVTASRAGNGESWAEARLAAR